MQITKIMNYLDKNISDVDRKLYNKLCTHVGKRHIRGLNLLVSTYHIEKKKFLFPTSDKINDRYINKLEELILYCKTIIQNKVNISTFDAKKFTIGKLLNLSNTEKVDQLLRHLHTYREVYQEITISKELIKSPLLILTINTKKRLDLGLLEKHAYDYCNNHALIEDKVKQVPQYLSAANVYTQNYILETEDTDIKQEVVNEAILDYFKNTGELYYMSGDIAQQVTKDVHERIEKKSYFSGGKAPYFIFDTIIPCSILLITAIVFILDLFVVNLDVVMIPLLIYNILSVVIYIARLGLVTSDEYSFCHNYYHRYPKRFYVFSITLFSSIIIQLIHSFKFNEIVMSAFNKFGLYLSKFYYNTDKLYTITTIIMGVLILITIIIALLFKHHKCIVSKVQAFMYLAINLGIRSYFWYFAVFRNLSIAFTTVAATLIIYCMMSEKKSKVLNIILLVLIFLDLIILLITNDQFYLRRIFNN